MVGWEAKPEDLRATWAGATGRISAELRANDIVASEWVLKELERIRIVRFGRCESFGPQQKKVFFHLARTAMARAPEASSAS